MKEDRIEMRILGLSRALSQDGSYLVILKGVESEKNIPILIDSNESMSILNQFDSLNKTTIYNILEQIVSKFDIKLKEVYIYSLEEGVFKTKIIAENGIQLDCTVGNGINVGLILNLPINVNIDVINEVGIYIDSSGNVTREEKNEIGIPEDKIDISDLEKLLEKAIEQEDYENASRLRDIINKMK